MATDGSFLKLRLEGVAMLGSTLTAREVEVIRLLARGLSAKQVAAELSIAPRTVEHHIDHARLKTQTRNRVHMVAHAIQEGIIDG